MFGILVLQFPPHQKMLAPKRQFGADSSEAYREMRPISALSNTPQTARRMQILKIQRVAAIHTTFISRWMNPGVHISRCTIGEPILKNSLKNLRKVLLHLRSSVRRSILMDIRSSKNMYRSIVRALENQALWALGKVQHYAHVIGAAASLVVPTESEGKETRKRHVRKGHGLRVVTRARTRRCSVPYSSQSDF